MNILKNLNINFIGRLFSQNRSYRSIKSIPVDDAYELIKNNGTFVLDVRSYQEFNNMHIKDAVNIPVTSLKYMTNLLPQEKNKSILVYCLNGVRARSSAIILEDMGYTNVYMWPSGSINNMVNKDIIQK